MSKIVPNASECPEDSLGDYVWKPTDQTCHAQIGFMCSRPEGHYGLHHAHGMDDYCYATWSDAPAARQAEVEPDRDE